MQLNNIWNFQFHLSICPRTEPHSTNPQDHPNQSWVSIVWTTAIQTSIIQKILCSFTGPFIYTTPSNCDNKKDCICNTIRKMVYNCHASCMQKKHGFVVFFPCLSSIPQILWVVTRSIAYTVDQPSIQVYLHKMPSCIFSIRFPLHSCWLALIYVITKDRDPSRRIPQKLLASNCDRTQILLVHN